MKLVKQYNIGKNTTFNLNQLSSDLEPGKYTIKTQAISANGKKSKESISVEYEVKDPLNPLGLPAFTIRCKFSSEYTPTMGESQTLVDATENVWDIYKNNTNWSTLFYKNTNLLQVLGANTFGVTNMMQMFHGCTSLVSVALFDTSTVTDIRTIFRECTSLKEVPLFDTSSATSVNSMFYGCTAVTGGALALYKQASTQTTVPKHTDTFKDCGKDTATGAAELSQIPEDWGGTYVPVDPYNPLGLPPFTIRCKFYSGYEPTMGTSRTLVDAGENVWDIGFEDAAELFSLDVGLLEVIGANTSSVTNMNKMFYQCQLLTSVALFDTSSVTSMSSMFAQCQQLTSVPLFNTSSCTNMGAMFRNCINVQSGALALYQQASSQATVTAHTLTFKSCGSNTESGAAELAQIPQDWGGTMA